MKARFFCANCSVEVNPRAERCPSCGKFFSAVTCPVCGFEGDVETFLKGCPACGYLVSAGMDKSKRGKKGSIMRNETGEGSSHQRHLSPAFYRIFGALLVAALVTLIAILIIRQ
jgi:hypothetical protein